MPLVRIDLRKGKQAAYREAISRIVHEGLVSVGVPKDDRFQVIAEHEPPNFIFDPNYLGVRRSEDLVIIQITWNEGRTVEQKKALYKAIADGLAAGLSLRREDVFIVPGRGQEGRTGRSATASRNTPDIRANAIAPARAVPGDIEMHVGGVEGVRARTQNRREPAAGRRPYRAEVGRFVRARPPLDRNAPLVRERDRNEIDRQSLRVSADLAPSHAILGPASIARTGLDRRDLGVQRSLPKRRDDKTHIVGEHRGEFASDQRAVRQAHRAAVRNDR